MSITNPKREPQLTGKQRAFVLEYLKDFNGTRSAIRAGYSKDAAAEIASENLRKPNIKAEIDRHLLAVGADSARTIGELAKVAYADISEYVDLKPGGEVVAIPFERLEPGMTRAIKKVKEKRKIVEKQSDENQAAIVVDNAYEFEMHDKLKALEILGKIQGLYQDKGAGVSDSEQPILDPGDIDPLTAIENIKRLLKE